MTAAAIHRGHKDSSTYFGMSRSMFMSVLFHSIIILLAIVGIPYIAREAPQIEAPIPIEVVTVADKSQTNKPPATHMKMDIPKQVDQKEPPKPRPPTNTTHDPLHPVPPKPPEVTKTEAKPVPAENAIAPPDKDLVKPKAPPKKPPKPAPDKAVKPEDQNDFNALLKNIEKNTPAEASPDSPVSTDKPNPEATLSDQMTMSEMDAVRKQLGECWKLLAGARYAEDLVVEIKIYMGPDKRVQNAEVVDQIRYNSDSFFRAAADSAMRAVYDPHCNPLEPLPTDKYTEWKELDVYFDPREMLQ